MVVIKQLSNIGIATVRIELNGHRLQQKILISRINLKIGVQKIYSLGRNREHIFIIRIAPVLLYTFADIITIYNKATIPKIGFYRYAYIFTFVFVKGNGLHLSDVMKDTTFQIRGLCIK